LTLESIPVYTEERIKSRERQGAAYTNDRKGLLKFLATAEPFYQKAESITTAEIINDHRTPTSFHSAYADGKNASAIAAGEFKNSAEFSRGEPRPMVSVANSGAESADIFEKVDIILKRFLQKEKSFSPADFGTIAHACVEALLNKREAFIPAHLGGHLSLTEADTLLAAGKSLAERFLQSPLGKIAETAETRKSEYQFRSLIKNSTSNSNTNINDTTKGLFINGTIDLLFIEGNTVHVVDFKTDSSENPAEHIPQMAFYYRAASELFDKAKTCRVWLYYLRTGHAVEMTGEAKNFNVVGLAAG
jgi:ATP-dependent helicase/nuclease subunit A